MSLALDKVNVTLVGNPVLRDISMRINPGELVCLVGRNGAGKSTTFRSIMGFQALKSGAINWKNKAINGMQTHKIVELGLGYTPEGSDVFGDLTVEDNIALPTWTRKSARSAQERIDEAYAVFPKLKQYLHRGGQQLSGGERKMVSIARALALDPELLLLDEAFEGLSPAIIPTISEGLQSILKQGRGVLLAESNFYHLPPFADRLYVIERGEIVFEGTLAQAEADTATMKIIKGT
ncbi:MAG: ATP-binding cassette domain-containing protein [Burkholderiaceae bacterium]|uniref:ATP-binding cassette domain-containing protein n=1 Tax=Herminiimonas contaminans TaxID=1111140 RepID=A0ABS0ETN9_9BURK|nr:MULTISPECIES: ATP-binding cassette domain-containing protein [Oxalobacteraceae]MBF8178114.1 ATP-binding cassette domain-containing protein [Herminiimonas contaminans]MBX9799273.1 ATP-binding cassette domain-containing protein [Burkholderiaceae bacterium]